MLRIYIDTSVIGGCNDKEFAPWSQRLMREFSEGIKIPVISDLTLQELELAPVEVQLVLKTIDDIIDIVNFNDEAARLANAYIEEKIVSSKYLFDAQHIALASVEKVDVMVSWNFKHIVNWNRIRLYNSVNLKLGYSLIDIRSPREVIDNESD